MLHSKIICTNCSLYKKCSQQRRMFVNYCGPSTKTLKEKIDKALSECHLHRGLIFKYQVVPIRKSLMPAV